MSHLLAALVGLALAAEPAAMVDLRKIDRHLQREPAYESKKPQYCLLVFGTQAETRVWVVLDGDWLYLDRNGNGDLTDPGERMSPVSASHEPKERPEMEVMRTYSFKGAAGLAGVEVTGPILSCRPEVVWFHIEHLLPREEFRDDPHWGWFLKEPFRVALCSTSKWEQYARLAFADRAEEAPILHFLGPQQATWDERQPLELRAGERAGFLAYLGTPGINAAVRTYNEFPKTAYAVADIEFPPKEPGGAAISQHVELREPC